MCNDEDEIGMPCFLPQHDAILDMIRERASGFQIPVRGHVGDCLFYVP
jgi:hypothetical protein